MKIDKYYGTALHYYPCNSFREKYGEYTSFRIVCKAKSLAEANRKALILNHGKDVFKRDYTSETGNKLEIEMADKYDFIISTDGMICRSFVSINEVIRNEDNQ